MFYKQRDQVVEEDSSSTGDKLHRKQPKRSDQLGLKDMAQDCIREKKKTIIIIIIYIIVILLY